MTTRPVRWNRSVLFGVMMVLSGAALSAGGGAGGGTLVTVVDGLPGPQVQLVWEAEAGSRYRVEKWPVDQPLEWGLRALVQADGPTAEWLDPDPLEGGGFYRVSTSTVEVYSVDAPILSSKGGALYLYGRGIPAGSSLQLEIEGQGLVTAELESLGSGSWQAEVSGTFTPGARVISANVVDGSGITLVQLPQVIEITLTGRALDGPAMLPPAAPLAAMALDPWRDPDDDGDGIPTYLTKKGYENYQMQTSLQSAHLTRKGYDYYQMQTTLQAAHLTKKGYDYYQMQTALQSAHLTKKGYDYYKARSDNSASRRAPAPSGLPGEVSFMACDLDLPSPAGPQLAWIRTYRSMAANGDGHGTGGAWDFSYNIRVEPLPAQAGAFAPRLLVHDGGGRADMYHRQADGSYRCDGQFREGRFTGELFTLTFADGGAWTFRPLDGSPSAGKISAITDRNDVSLVCDYNLEGLLSTVSDTFGRSLSVKWGDKGVIDNVSDSTGRIVQYTYYGDADKDGNPGDLKSVSCPQVQGLPPVAGDTAYTYTTGFADSSRNHNLLSMRDGAGRLMEAFAYADVSDPTAVDYDTCIVHDRHSLAGIGHTIVVKMVSNSDGDGPAGGYTLFHNDELGRVAEVVMDRQHRPVSIRQYTGYAKPGEPVTAASNRPTGKLRDDDPEFYETRLEYNVDHALTRCVMPDGSELLTTFEGDLNPAAPVRERGNARTLTLRAVGGETRTISMEYLPGFGNPEPNARPGNPIGGLTIKGGRNPGGNYTPQGRAGSGDPKPRRYIGTEECDDGNSSARPGSPIGGFTNPIRRKYALMAEKERGITINTSHVEYGSKKRKTTTASGGIDQDCDGFERLVGGIDQDCDGRDDDCDGIAAYFRKILDYGEAGDNSCMLTRLTTPYGQVYKWGFDTSGNCTSYSTPIAGAGNLAEFNGLGQCTSTTVLGGPDTSLRTRFDYDPSSAFLVAVVCDDNAEGTGLALTTTYERDDLGRVVGIVDSRGEDWIFEYNALHQCTRWLSPAVGTDPASAERIATTCIRDAAGRLVRVDVEHRDPGGALYPGNPAYSTFLVYDARGRLVRVAEEERPVDAEGVRDPQLLGIENFAVCDIGYDEAGQLVRLSVPAASREQPDELRCDYSFDERGLLHRVAEGGSGNPDAVTTEFTYDAAGALTSRAVLDPGSGPPATSFSYDGFHRLVACTDPMGNVVNFEYDNKGVVTVSHIGEVIDEAGSDGNVLLARARYNLGLANPFPGPMPFALQLPGISDVCYDLKVSSAFHAYVTEDEIVIEERFSPGDEEPYPTDTTVYDRSPAGLLKQVTRNGDPLLSIGYDSGWRPVVLDNGASQRTNLLDEAALPFSDSRIDYTDVADAPQKSYTTTFKRDALGRVVERTDGVGNRKTWAYDSLGRCVELVEPGGLVVSFEYDGEDVSGPFSQKTVADVNHDGSPDVLFASYARCGQLVSETDSNGHQTTLTRDMLGRVVRTDHPDGTFEAFAYNALGQLRQLRQQDGSTVDMECDFNGRTHYLSSASVQEGVASSETQYGYDGLGRIVRATQLDEFGHTLSLAYDSLGNLVREDQGGFVITRTFDHRGRTGITYPDGSQFAETRDSLGLLLTLTKVNKDGGDPSPPVVTNAYAGERILRRIHFQETISDFTYRSYGEVSEPPGSEDFSFDAAIQVRQSTGDAALISETEFRRDPNQRATGRTSRHIGSSQATGHRLSMVLNDLGYLTGAVMEQRAGDGQEFSTVRDVAYDLDLEGRRLLATGGNNPGAYSQSAEIPPGDLQMGQYTTWPGGPLEWDDNGRLTLFSRKEGPFQLSYDALGRLVSAVDSTSGLEVTHDYDGLGRRIRTTLLRDGLPPAATRFIYDDTTCIQEIGAGGTALLTFAAEGGLQYAAYTSAGGVFQLHQEGIVHRDIAARNILHSGGPLLVCDQQGAVVERIDFDESGAPIFLDADGLPVAGRSRSLINLRWLQPDAAWTPGLNVYFHPDGVFSTDLGIPVTAPVLSFVAKEKEKPRSTTRHELKGHVTLIK